MSEQTFTHKDIAGLLGVSETTVKSYRRKFPGCIPVSSKGKPIRFTPEALSVATRIRDLFETGMSVEEVRSRLTSEFAWIQPEDNRSARGAGKKGASPAEIGPELSQGVSNMAKSMVAMTQQQKAILTRIQGLEALLEDLGLKDGENQGDLAQLLDKRAEAARQRQALLENRLDSLDAKAGHLAETVQTLSDQLDRFIGHRANAAAAWRNEAESTLADAARAAGQAVSPAFPGTPPAAGVQTASLAAMPSSPSAENADGAANAPQILPMRRDRAATFAQAADRPPSGTTQEQAVQVGAAPQEPPRRFFGLPLVARTEQGQYISAGGKSRGPFSLNDLKAMLIYGFTPPNHFTLRWDSHGQGWRLLLEQEKTERRLHLLLMELPTQRGGSVVEILQIKDADAPIHPAEICGIIDSFAS